MRKLAAIGLEAESFNEKIHCYGACVFCCGFTLCKITTVFFGNI